MSVQIRQRRYVGERELRVEDPRLLRGKGNYIDDIVVAGMAHAAFVRSPFPHARINSIDVAPALALDGVYGVFTGEDLNPQAGPLIAGRNDYGMATLGSDLLETKRQLLAVDKARHVGDAVDGDAWGNLDEQRGLTGHRQEAFRRLAHKARQLRLKGIDEGIGSERRRRHVGGPSQKVAGR